MFTKEIFSGKSTLARSLSWRKTNDWFFMHMWNDKCFVSVAPSQKTIQCKLLWT